MFFQLCSLISLFIITSALFIKAQSTGIGHWETTMAKQWRSNNDTINFSAFIRNSNTNNSSSNKNNYINSYTNHSYNSGNETGQSPVTQLLIINLPKAEDNEEVLLTNYQDHEALIKAFLDLLLAYRTNGLPNLQDQTVIEGAVNVFRNFLKQVTEYVETNPDLVKLGSPASNTTVLNETRRLFVDWIKMRGQSLTDWWTTFTKYSTTTLRPI